MIGYSGAEPDEEFARVLRETGAMGVILFARNAASAAAAEKAIKRLRSFVDRPLVVAVDQEGGAVVRLVDGVTTFPGNAALGAAGDVELARAQGEIVGRQLAAAGFDLNLAPVVDRALPGRHPIVGTRSFGDNPKLVAAMARALIDGHHAGGVGSCLKHFPGLGAAHLDPHEELPRLDGGPDGRAHADVAVFADVLKGEPRPAVMTTHVIAPHLDPDNPVTFSPKVVRGLLRGDLEFGGVIIADDLEMGAIIKHHAMGEAVVACAAAGHDFIPVCHDANRQLEAARAMAQALEEGVLDRDEHEAAVARIAALARGRGGLAVRRGRDASLAAEIAMRGARVLSDPPRLLPLCDRRIGVVTFIPPTDPGHETTWGPSGAAGPAETLGVMSLMSEAALEEVTALEFDARAASVDVSELPSTEDIDILVVAVWRPRLHDAQRAFLEEAARRFDGRLVLLCLDGADDDVLEPRQTALTAHGWKTPNLLALARRLLEP